MNAVHNCMDINLETLLYFKMASIHAHQNGLSPPMFAHVCLCFHSFPVLKLWDTGPVLLYVQPLCVFPEILALLE